MKNIFTFICLFLSLTIFAQKPDTEKILNEGKMLYRLEKASWLATDHFLQDFSSKKGSMTGYLSYETSDNKIATIFYNRTEKTNRILVRYEFDKNFSQKPFPVDTDHPDPLPLEDDLIALREEAVKQINTNKDRYFTFYEGTSFNLIPLIEGKKRMVYVLTASRSDDVVLIGNDYLLKYNRKNQCVSKEKIHNSLLEFPTKKQDMILQSTYHSHVLSAVISSTDICTLLLYKDLVDWQTHYVISKSYVSIFSLEKESLVIITREAWDKISKSQD